MKPWTIGDVSLRMPGDADADAVCRVPFRTAKGGLEDGGRVKSFRQL